jgi:hypothetical protein
MGETDTTIDFVAVGVIVIVIGFIVYEISQAAQSVSESGGWLWGALGAGAAALLLL